MWDLWRFPANYFTEYSALIIIIIIIIIITIIIIIIIICWYSRQNSGLRTQ
jgi:hypothetical protein